MNTSELRQEIFRRMAEYARLMDLKNKRILEVGIAGDPKPGGNYLYFGEDNIYETLDVDDRYEPDYVCDIRDTKLKEKTFDLIILSQTIEHMTHPEQAIKECRRLLKKGGYLILDCPWNYPYHPDDDFDDYVRYSEAGLKQMSIENGFKIVSSSMSDNLSSCLCKKQ